MVEAAHRPTSGLFGLSCRSIRWRVGSLSTPRSDWSTAYQRLLGGLTLRFQTQVAFCPITAPYVLLNRVQSICGLLARRLTSCRSVPSSCAFSNPLWDADPFKVSDREHLGSVANASANEEAVYSPVMYREPLTTRRQCSVSAASCSCTAWSRSPGTCPSSAATNARRGSQGPVASTRQLNCQ